MFIVRDYKQKILMKCNSRDGVLMAIITFSGLFGSEEMDIKIESSEIGEEMTCKEFYDLR